MKRVVLASVVFLMFATAGANAVPLVVRSSLTKPGCISTRVTEAPGRVVGLGYDWFIRQCPTGEGLEHKWHGRRRRSEFTARSTAPLRPFTA